MSGEESGPSTILGRNHGTSVLHGASSERLSCKFEKAFSARSLKSRFGETPNLHLKVMQQNDSKFHLKLSRYFEAFRKDI
jgi:hypothetical protein